MGYKRPGHSQEDQLRARMARRERPQPWRWIVLGAAVTLVLAAIVVAVGSYWWFTGKVETANERTPESVKAVLTSLPSTTLVSVEQTPEALNIILLGSDTTGDDPDGGASTTTAAPSDTTAATGASAGAAGAAGRSSTIMVLHVDPKADFACLLSISRDLYVDIPGHGKGRISTAYSLGGPQLTIETVKNLIGVNIDRYVEVGFDSFEKIIDSLGGVYVDVDRLYDDRAHAIHLQPGYQLLKGSDALLFARYRYDGNRDAGRMSRQQRVLAAVRDQAFGWDLPVKVPGMVGTILDATATNLTANEIIKLSYWLVKLDGDHMRQMTLTGPGQTIDGHSVTVAGEAGLKETVTKLLTSPAAGSTGAAPAGATSTTVKPATPTSTTAKSTSSAADPWQAAQNGVPFALESPGFIPAGLTFAYKVPAAAGVYQMDPSGTSKPAVRMVYRLGAKDLYLGITATSWTGAPAASEGQEVEANGVKYTVVGTSGKVERIWWKTGGVLYFISNTLTHDVSRDDLLRMAESMAPVAAAR